MTEAKIARINELAKKKKTVGLTEEEAQEQQVLRREFIDSIKADLKSQLDNIDMVNEDGTVENLGEKYGKKKKIGSGSYE